MNQSGTPKESYRYKISIILCTYQGYQSIAQSITSLLRQNFPKRDYEVIAISHGVPDLFSGKLFKKIKNLKTIFVPMNPRKPYQPSFVRNKGIDIAEGKLVFFLHDNVDLEGDDYLQRVWEYSDYGKGGLATHKIMYKYNADGSINHTVDVSGFFAHQDAVPLKFLKQVGGFDEIYDGDYGCDDVDLMNRCEDVGCIFYINKELTSIKHNRRAMFSEQKRTTRNQYPGDRNRKILSKRGFFI